MSCLRTIQTQRFINAKETDTSARTRGSISTSGQTRSRTPIKVFTVKEYGSMRKKKDIEVVIHKDIEKEMKRIADNIFGYNPKIDPRDPLFRKTLSWSVKKEGKGKKNEKND